MVEQKLKNKYEGSKTSRIIEKRESYQSVGRNIIKN
jgi:hypothetical protein